MTSKAERKRRKRFARKIRNSPAQKGPMAETSDEGVPTQAALSHDSPTARRSSGGMTDAQEAAWRWFYGLRKEISEVLATRVAENDHLSAARLQLTDDEYAVLCELCRPSLSTAYRIGRSRQTVHALHMSALRKLVAYRHMNDVA